MLQFWKRDQPQPQPPFDTRELSGIDRNQAEADRRLHYWEVELASHGERWLNA